MLRSEVRGQRLTHTDAAIETHGQPGHALTPEGALGVDTVAVHAHPLGLALIDVYQHETSETRPETGGDKARGRRRQGPRQEETRPEAGGEKARGRRRQGQREEDMG